MEFDDVFKLARVVACDSVVFKRGRVLLVKRSTQPMKGWWCLPGGLMDLGETCEQTAVRELFEETGYRGRVAKLVGVYSNPRRDSRQTVAVAFPVEPTGGRARASGETSELKFFALNALPLKVAFDHAAVIRDAKRLL